MGPGSPLRFGRDDKLWVGPLGSCFCGNDDGGAVLGAWCIVDAPYGLGGRLRAELQRLLHGGVEEEGVAFF